jgi:hypothetical protein
LSFEETELEHELKTHPKYKRLQNYSSRRVLEERFDRFRGSTLIATATETTYWTATDNPTIKTGIGSTKDTLTRQYVETKRHGSRHDMNHIGDLSNRRSSERA